MPVKNIYYLENDKEIIEKVEKLAEERRSVSFIFMKAVREYVKKYNT